MARDFVSVNLTMSGDPDWRALPVSARDLYMSLWCSPKRTWCGTHDWRPTHLSGLADDLTPHRVRVIGDLLRARHFLVVDEEKEEALIRSCVRFDGTMRNPSLAVACVNAYAAAASPILRAVIVDELHKIKTLEPDLSCWSKPKVAEVLDHPRQSAKALPVPDDLYAANPVPWWDLDLGAGLGAGSPLSQGVASPPSSPPSSPPASPPTSQDARGSVSPPRHHPPLSVPVPESTPSVVKGGAGGNEDDPGEGKPSRSRSSKKKAQETPLPDDWEPTENHRARCEEAGLDLGDLAAEFRDYWGEGQTAASWNGKFATWISRAKSFRAERGLTGPATPLTPPRRLITADKLEEPPHGLTDEERAVWYRGYHRRLYGGDQ